ncbi:hypothetical protein HII17_10130 [Thalassotalea sp. M1531]|uniref:MSHA biogenesis protein MshK n=1 Tax=Thalassotalea algicola TaxID=2716224 RepID=A0A7Y0Q6E2_9GAMM|nr:hypothetical protein [Thalassotalea algicola]NMP31924.1 hypothetical protein [Thalassotalea algicola]
MYKLIIGIVFSLVALNVLAKSDPTMPLRAGLASTEGSERQKNSDIVLQSIIKSTTSTNLKAIISGKLVEQGQKLFGYTIVKIDGRSVTLQSEDRARKLTLFTQSVVKYK